MKTKALKFIRGVRYWRYRKRGDHYIFGKKLGPLSLRDAIRIQMAIGAPLRDEDREWARRTIETWE